MSDALITCANLTFAWPDGTPVFDGLSFALGARRTGLVAPNGAGKTTLLRLIAGAWSPSGGTLAAQGEVGYLPQDLPFTGELTVAEALGIAPVLRALQALASGDASDAVYTAIGDAWDIEERTRAELDRLGLGGIDLERRLGTCSGGEVVSLGLAGQLLKRPDVLLLDEPTNNLDRNARRRLHEVLGGWNGCLLLVSHDRELLDRMDAIAELHRGELRFYGGNFSDYEAAVRVEQEAAGQQLRSARQEVRREKREMQQARERADRRSGNAARNLASAGIPRIVAGKLKRAAQESAGKSDRTHAARLGEARSRLENASRALRNDDALALDLPATRVPGNRLVFAGEALQVRRGGRTLFSRGGIDLLIRGPERIALTGANGVGKSTLLRLVGGELQPDAGDIRRGGGRIATLPQRLDLLDPDRSVAANLAAFAPGVPEAERMNLLARFLFRGSRMHLAVGALSGGERLRATLACILCAQPAPQLLLLDEPTNNLDLVSVAQLESALRAYEGALLVVSHDERFLAGIDIDRWLRLDAGRLVEEEAQNRQ